MAGGTSDSDFDDRFDALFRTAYRAAYRLSGRRHEAEDVAQEVLARCYVRWRRVRGYAEAWVYRAATNLAIDRWRGRERCTERVDPQTSDRMSNVDLRNDLVVALAGLSNRQRDVVVLRYLLDLPEREVAAVLGCSVGTVKQHAHRGLEAMRGQLGQSYAVSFPRATPTRGDPVERGVIDGV